MSLWRYIKTRFAPYAAGWFTNAPPRGCIALKCAALSAWTIAIWLNGLTAEEKILGGRIEFREDENPDTSLMAGKATFHVFMTPCSPAKHLEFILEYDVDYLSALFE